MIFFCMCMCMVYIHAFVCVWRFKVDDGCVYWYSPLYLFSQGLSRNLKLTDLASLASWLSPEIQSPPPEGWSDR